MLIVYVFSISLLLVGCGGEILMYFFVDKSVFCPAATTFLLSKRRFFFFLTFSLLSSCPFFFSTEGTSRN